MTKKNGSHSKSTSAIAGIQTRAHIIECACDLISEGGYEALTASALAKRAGISKGGLYHHFEKMTEVVTATYKNVSMRVFSSLSRSQPGSFDDYLDDVEHIVFNVMLNDTKTLRVFTELYPKLMFDPSFKQARKDSFRNIINIMSDIIKDGSKIDSKQLELALNAVAVFVGGLVVQNGEVRNIEQTRELWHWFREMLHDRVIYTETVEAL